MRALADEGFAVELNDGIPPAPRDQMARIASLPRPGAEQLRDEIEAAGVPVVMFRADAAPGPDGAAVPEGPAPWTCSSRALRRPGWRSGSALGATRSVPGRLRPAQ